MAVLQVKKYKTIKDENGNKIQVQKTKEEWNKETRNGTMTWYFYCRYEINNKKKQYKSKLFALKREAEEQERFFRVNPLEYIKTASKRAKNSQITNINISSKTLNDYFEDFIAYEREYIKPSSICEYKNSWENHIADILGDLTPEQLDFPTIQLWRKTINEKVIKIKNSTIKKRYSIQTKNKWYSALSEFLEYLKRETLIEANYIKAIGQFKNPNENKNKKKEIKYQTLEEFNLFMSEIDESDFWYVFFNFAFWHGCRIGEQRALKIKDVDLENDIIHIYQSVSLDENGKEVIGPIKNNEERYIVLSNETKPHLIKLINFYKAMDGYSNEWFLFGGSIRQSKNSIQRKLENTYKILIKKYPDKKINPLTHHPFARHSHASYLLNKFLEKGIPREIIYEMIAERLGDTPEVIKETYAHPYETKYNDKMKELLNGKEENAT